MAWRHWQVSLVLFLDSREERLVRGTAVDVGLLGHLPLPAFVLGEARAALRWVVGIMEDGFMVLCVFSQVKILL